MHLPQDDLVLRRLQRIESQFWALAYLTRGVLTLLGRMAAGEQVPLEHIQSLENALNSLETKVKR